MSWARSWGNCRLVENKTFWNRILKYKTWSILRTNPYYVQNFIQVATTLILKKSDGDFILLKIFNEFNEF